MSKSGSKTPKTDQTKCHAPFSARKHVGGDMPNMSVHDVMSRHVVMSCHVAMSCHVVTLEIDPCVCPCQYSPTHVKYRNPCLCAKCPFQCSRPNSCIVGLVKVWLENAQNHTMFDMFSLTCLSCEKGVWHFFSLFLFVFKLDFHHGMMTCSDMFYMFSLTCLSCDLGAWHFLSLFFFVFKPDFDHGMMACHDMFDMF